MRIAEVYRFDRKLKLFQCKEENIPMEHRYEMRRAQGMMTGFRMSTDCSVRRDSWRWKDGT